MKKILSLCLTALLVCLFLLPAAAEFTAPPSPPSEPGDGMYIILDNPYTHLYYHDEVYSRADVSELHLAKESRKGANVGFEEYNGVGGISLWATPNNTVFWIDLKGAAPVVVSLGDPTASGMFEFVGLYVIPDEIPELAETAIRTVYE